MDEALRGHHHQARRQVIAGLRLHDGDGDHVHEMGVGRRGELVEYIWKVENVELTTVGIDIGSSTSHLMFARVRLQRKTQALSSQFVVVERRVLWKSPIRLTPFLPDGTIDAASLGDFLARCYLEAGLAAGEIDTGAVILTGEAIKKSNARALAELFAADSGNFVCASAGHHLESVLAAHGSGAVARSREIPGAILNVDVGGGTTKLALVSGGEIVSTCAFAIGGRLVAFDAGGRITRIDASAQLAAQAAAVSLRIGERPQAADLARVVDALADTAIALIRGEPPTGLGRRLMLTDVPPLPWERVAAITFSGGVSEYIYGREMREFGDIAKALAGRVAAACADGRIATPVAEPREGIRATVIGASQFSVQVSGKTIHIGDGARLPLRNVPVIAPALALDEAVVAPDVAKAIRTALERAPSGEDRPIALAIRWRGEPHYRRLRALAEGIAAALPLLGTDHSSMPDVLCPPKASTLVLMLDSDVGRTLGHILEHELRLGRPVVSIDGIELREFDFVDIGEVIRPADVVPVVIKSLLFSGAPLNALREDALTYKPVMEKKLQ